MEDDNELTADEILDKYGDTMNFHLDNIIDPPNDDGEMNLIKPSPYFGIDCLPHSLVHTRGQLNILSINAQSLNSKYDELLLLLNIAQSQKIRFHVICVQETWLSEMSEYSLVAIDSYNCIHQSKRAECSNHGGLIIYVDNKYEVDRLDIKNDSSLWEKLFVSIKGTGHNKDVIVGNIYKPPKDNYNIENINTFTIEIENVIHELDRRNSEILIAHVAGDYNIDLLNFEVRQAFSDFFDTMLAKSLFPRIILPTKLDKNSCTLIDNIYFKLSPLFIDATSGIIFSRISDHFSYFLSLKLQVLSNDKRSRFVKVYTNKKNGTHALLESIPAANTYELLDDNPYLNPNLNYSKLHSCIMELKENICHINWPNSTNTSIKGING